MIRFSPSQYHALTAICTCILALLSGCSKFDSIYGESRGSKGQKSINGFGAVRTAFEREGFRSRDLTTLNKRTLSHDVIFWTPKTETGLDRDTSRWLNNWLKRDHKTLVMVIPDSGSAAQYFRDAIAVAPPKMRMEYRRRYARQLLEEQQWRKNRTRLSSGWYTAVPLQSSVTVQEKDQEIEIEIDYVLVEPDVEVESISPPIVFSQSPTGPTMPFASMTPANTNQGDSEIKFRSIMSADKLFEETKEDDAVQAHIIAELSHPDWKESRVIVVAGGSLLTNYAVTKPFGSSLARTLAAEAALRTSLPAKGQQANNDQSATSTAASSVAASANARRKPVASFASTGHFEIPIRQSETEITVPDGMGFLTAWPISLISVHVLITGMVICLILFPIFGRPHRIRGRSVSDFSGHLEAVALLMHRRGSYEFARERIDRYRSLGGDNHDSEYNRLAPLPNDDKSNTQTS